MRLRTFLLALAISLGAAPLLPAQQVMPDTTRARRWAELHVLMIGELRSERRDLRDIIRSDFSTLEVSLRRASDTTFTRRILTAEEIDRGNLTELASRLVADARSPSQPRGRRR
jgi:hypothetical protein